MPAVGGEHAGFTDRGTHTTNPEGKIFWSKIRLASDGLITAISYIGGVYPDTTKVLPAGPDGLDYRNVKMGIWDSVSGDLLAETDSLQGTIQYNDLVIEGLLTTPYEGEAATPYWIGAWVDTMGFGGGDHAIIWTNLSGGEHAYHNTYGGFAANSGALPDPLPTFTGTNGFKLSMWATVASGGTVEYIGGEFGSEDATIRSKSAWKKNYGADDDHILGYITTNFGTGDPVDTSEVLFKLNDFDKRIPSGDIVTACSLRVYNYTNTANTDSAAVYTVIRKWTEGRFRGARFDTFMVTFTNCSTSTAWGTLGANNTTNDRESNAHDVISISATGYHAWALDTADVNAWITGDMDNYGVLAVDKYFDVVDQGKNQFYASEDGKTSGQSAYLNPTWVISYATPSTGGVQGQVIIIQ